MLEIIKDDVRKIKPSFFKGVFAVIDLVGISNDPSGEYFGDITYEINNKSRIKTAKMAKSEGVSRYLLPSSCSVYGLRNEEEVDENSKTYPISTYSKSNEQAELGVLKLSDKNFTVVVLRQATVYGSSPRMRFDLVVNNMAYNAWANKKIQLMRNGKQWRPLIHIYDLARAYLYILKLSSEDINGQIINIGSDNHNFQMQDLASNINKLLGGNLDIQWYGDPDMRSYKVSFKKFYQLGYKSEISLQKGVNEIINLLKKGDLTMNDKTLTLKWYKELDKWNKIISQTKLYDGILEI